MDKLFFYSQSKDLYPGEGKNEFVKNKDDYLELSKIKDWRKILSNFHVCKFKYEGFTYNTIEHAFQAKKISLVDKDKAFLFTIESGNEIGLGDGNIARKNRKIVILTDAKINEWNNIKENVMYDISFEKYNSCQEAKDVLLKTNDSELWHIVMRSPNPIRFTHLEKIRNLYKKNKDNSNMASGLRLRKLTKDEIDYIINGIDMKKYNLYKKTKEPKYYQELPIFRMTPLDNNPIYKQSFDLNMKYLKKQLENIQLALLDENNPDNLKYIDEFRILIVKKYLKSLVSPGTNVGIQAADALGAPITQMTLNSFHNSGKRANTTTGIERMKEILHATKNMKARIGKVIFKTTPKTFKETLSYRNKLVDIKISDLIDNKNSNIMSYVEFVEFINENDKKWIFDYYSLLSGDKFFDYNENKYKNYVGVYKIDKYKLFIYKITLTKIIDTIYRNQIPDMLKIIKTDMDDPYLFIFFDSNKDIEVDMRTLNNAFMCLSDFVYEKVFNLNIHIPNGVKKFFVSEINTSITNNLWINENDRKNGNSLFYAETEGINLLNVLGLDFVDYKRTHSNDPQQIKEVLGLEAARYSIIDEIQYVIKEASEISIRHLLLLVDYMTYMGKITPISIIGSTSKDEGTLLAASRSKATETITAAALVGNKDYKNPTVQISFGALASGGTANMDILVNEKFKYMDEIDSIKLKQESEKKKNQPKNEKVERIKVIDIDEQQEENEDLIVVNPKRKPKVVISSNNSFNIFKLLNILEQLNY